jgi:hypothetical protein
MCRGICSLLLSSHFERVTSKEEMVRDFAVFAIEWPCSFADSGLFELFSQMSDNLIAGARALVDLFEHYEDIERKIDDV